MAAAPSDPTSTPPTERGLLWLVASAIFMQMLDTTVVNTALPAMALSLGESPLHLQRVVIAYALAGALLIPASGWLADRFGTRRVFTLAVVLFTAGSLCCALAPTLAWLVAARVVQGFGGAMLLPIGRLSVMQSVGRGQFLAAMSFITVPAQIGPLLGPTLGGWLAQSVSWHWIFLINVPVGILVGWQAQRLMPDRRRADLGPFDLTGALLLSGALVLISLALDGVAGAGGRRIWTLLMLVFGAAALGAYALHAARSPAPLFPPRLFALRTYRTGLIGNLFARLGSGAIPYLTPLLLQLSVGLSPLHAGLMMIPSALAGMAARPWVVGLVRRHGYRQVVLVNTVLVALAVASLGLIGPGTPIAWIAVQLAIFGAVNGIQFTVMNTLTLTSLDETLASPGNSLLSMVMMLSMSFGVAIAANLLAGFHELFDQAQGAASPMVFHATFVGVGLITLASTLVFLQLDRDGPAVEGRGAEGRGAPADPTQR